MGEKLKYKFPKHSYDCCFGANFTYYTPHTEKTSQVNQGTAHIFSFEKELEDLNSPQYPLPTQVYYDKQDASPLYKVNSTKRLTHLLTLLLSQNITCLLFESMF